MKRSSKGAVMVSVGLAAGILAGVLAGCKGDKPSASTPPPSSTHVTPPATASAEPAAAAVPVGDFAGADAYEALALSRLELPSGVIIEDLKLGEGEPALPRAVLTFHYRGMVKGGKEFEATVARPAGPTPEVQPVNKLIPGLSSGLVGLKVGGRRRITVPPQLAPGVVGIKDPEGNYRIEPDATLIYVVDAVAIKQQLVTTPGQP